MMFEKYLWYAIIAHITFYFDTPCLIHELYMQHEWQSYDFINLSI